MEPKPRQISAPAFRDVVVQHAIYGLLNPIFDRGFIHDSYGCRVAKGTHMASDRVQRYLRKHSLFRFSRNLKAGDVPSLNSILGNALRTSSHAHMCRRIRAERPELICQLPSVRNYYANI